ncbi:AraC family transcriptional regulator ligand-binding domain-containing protein [Streptacidiphilus sp. N1-10]|uniref:AraC family transcriptional regulator ligand-binding domain-containing protein n=1 Tax=Streptacidiphilus jeojiensis TaxID=3229225 RepID=A0ABV6XVX6_9ACTN
MGWVSSATLGEVRSTIEQLGGDAEAMVCRAGIPAAALDGDEVPVRDTAVAAMLEAAARELHCPDFGMRVALRQDLGHLGPLAVALRNAPTAADALGYTAKYWIKGAAGFTLTQVPDPLESNITIGLRFGYPEFLQAAPQSIDRGLLFVHRAMTYLFHGGYGLRTVELPHPPLASRARYEELFGAQVNFDRPGAVLRVPADLPHRTFGESDQLSRDLALFYLDSQVSTVGHPITGRVSVIVRHSLGTGPTTMAGVAGLLAMSPRTLQRQLADEGTTFSDVLDTARRDRAQTLLSQSDLTMAQVAASIGLHSSATLSRYAQRWWRTTPSAVRRRTNDG